MDARGEERPLGEKREAHRGGEFLGLREVGCERTGRAVMACEDVVRLEPGMSSRTIRWKRHP